MTLGTVRSNGLDIAYETTGEGPPLVMIMGIGAPMVNWPEGFYRAVVEAGFTAIRFDNRDVGRSSKMDHLGIPPVWPLMARRALGRSVPAPYTLGDMADDVAGLLDGLHLDSAHVIGASMGGMITQLVGLNHPARVLSLLPIMSSPDPAAVTDPLEGKAGSLSPPTEAVQAAIADGAELDWSDTQAVLENRVEMFAVLAGSGYPYVVEGRRALFQREIDRASNMSSSANHGLVVAATERWYHRLGEVTAPTLVIHGDEDPILPLDHGRAIAEAIAGATLLVLEGAGHEIPEGTLDQVIPAILEATT